MKLPKEVHFKKKTLLLLLCAMSELAFAQTPPATSPATNGNAAATPAIAPVAAPAPAPGLRPFKDIIKDAKELKGFFNLYQKDDKVWMEIRPEQFDKPFLFTYNIPNSIGERGLYGSQMGRGYQAVFKRIGNQVQLLARNTEFYATPGTPQALAVAQAFSDSLLASAPVLSSPNSDSKGILVDASTLLFNDIPAYSTRLEFAYRTMYVLDKPNTSFGKLTADESLAGFFVNAHFATPRIAAAPLVPPPVPMPTPPQTTPDPRSFFVGFYFNFAALPAEVMRSRLADDRLGHFVTTSYDFTEDIKPKTSRHFVNRWRLEKQDPAAALSEPKQPIVYWLDKNVPEKYRKSITEGVLEWNKAFEKIGFKNAVVAKQQTEKDNFDTMDARHASIRWFVGADVGFAIGPSRVDERSGEILDADIGMSDVFARGARRMIGEDAQAHAMSGHAHGECNFAHEASMEMGFAMDLLDARGEVDMDSPKAEALAQAYVKDVIMHEVGHTLGLRHNFRSSTIYTLKQLQDPAFTKVNGMAGSIMDYVPFNLATKGEPQGEYVMSSLGPYDYWAIEYAYKPVDADKEKEELARIASRSTEPLLAYGTDEDSMGTLVSDPDVNVFDLGSDPLAYIQKRLTISRELWDRLQTRQLKTGDSYETLRRSFEYGFGQFARTMPVATKFVGGTTFLRDHAGTGRATYTPIAAERQRQALKLVSDSLFTAKSFVFSPELLSRMGVDHFQRANRNDISISARLLGLQTAALDQLMSDVVAQRMLNAAEKLRDPKKMLSLHELYGTLQTSIWSELSSGADIVSARRNLQREHLKRLSNALLKPAATTPADARSLQREQANQLLVAIRAAVGKPMSAEARAHLSESLATLNEVLKASLVRTGV
ncbi:zinc-dependent metalloprotease [Undibacterium umbellatum]|uniref:Zinc-dependent metalloprotease n=1 Tax=Undibacterium umbellatum TaxID=2762300 RepID=A0ABR6Z614_9BURK|nr:zinc-dependent metalloprotease [Undibacterium umbellatum]MBC3907182.1 zinc-dependent metalloprotease [Undibacterium umbellatum]